MESPSFHPENKLYEISRDCKRQDGNPLREAELEENRELGRTPFQKDYARLLHSASFRRLQGKTQLYPGHEDDFFRTRLTHSLEVAQIAAGIAQFLNIKKIPSEFGKHTQIDLDLVQFAALAHDLGHPPFGHNGERALDELMRSYGGFEGNAQTLRILSVVEKKLISLNDGTEVASHGRNLTYRSLASVLKYDKEISSKRNKTAEISKGYYSSERELVKQIKGHVAPRHGENKFKTIECYIMDVADDIAYSTYDLEDSLYAGFITPTYLFEAITPEGGESTSLRDQIFSEINGELEKEEYEKLDSPEKLSIVIAELFKFMDFKVEPENGGSQRARTALTLVEAQRFNSQYTSKPLEKEKLTAKRVGNLIRSVELVPNKEFPQLSRVRLNREKLISVELLKRLNFMLTIKSSRLTVTEYKGKEYVKQIFNSIIESDGNLLPEHWKLEYNLAKNSSQKNRVVCDYVAGMTDRHAAEFHGRLFSEGASVFKPL
ncbi:dNTP triphosphohydrolase [Hahella sp. CR1]|uniref:dGTP triphosphohydrolase n=1 Tax=Hahella sp. CR1 TaxID=2992807 RepID=UPI0024427A6F|nr:dNTP triphosphohydrolase [Hahella sp. CR1]MDG9667091.1 dNTP triphosphohydrolase [Hahella sp. CR1]